MAVTRRHTVLAGVVVLALAAGGGWWWTRHGTDHHEQVTAARGPYPARFGSAPPDDPARVLRRTDDAAGLVDGLSVGVTRTFHYPSTAAVVAHDLRTGKAYWRYQRTGTDLEQVDTSAASGTVATWWDDGLLVAVDARAGTPRWRRTVPYPGHGQGAARSDDFADMAVVGDLVATESSHQLAAYAAGDGGKRWTAAPPEGCTTFESGTPVAMAHVVVVQADCGRPTLVGYDAARGTVRWQVRQTIPALRRADDHTLVSASSDEEGNGVVIDVSGSKPALHTWKRGPDCAAAAVDSDVLLCDGDQGHGPTTLSGYGTADGAHRWSVAPAKGTRFGRPLIAGGLVYVVQQPRDAFGKDPEIPIPPDRYRATLLVLDTATGRQLHAVPLPPIPMGDDPADLIPDAALQADVAGDGLVSVVWAGPFGPDRARGRTVMAR